MYSVGTTAPGRPCSPDGWRAEGVAPYDGWRAEGVAPYDGWRAEGVAPYNMPLCISITNAFLCDCHEKNGAVSLADERFTALYNNLME